MASDEFNTMMRGLQSLADQGMADRLLNPADSMAVAREKLNALHGHPVAPDTRVNWTQLGGVRCAWVQVPGVDDASPCLFLCHGGAYIAAGGDGYLFYAEMLGRACGARVCLVDYRLAPENHYPAALDDLVDAYRGLVNEDAGEAPGRIAIIGDSCGGALAVATLLRIRDEDLPAPAVGVALGGWFDHETPSGDREADPIRDPFAHPDFTRARGRDYVGVGEDLRNPFVSPVYASLKDLPPLLLQVGDVDLTFGDAERLRARANADGVDTTFSAHPEMIHGFQGLASAGIPEAHAALAEVAAFISARIR